MATAKKTYDPEKEYDLKVSRKIQDGPFPYLPRHDIVAKGSVINRIIEEHGADAIRSAVARK